MITEFSITPIGSGVSVSSAVAKAVRVVRDSGLPYALNPMGTVVEGSWGEVMDVIRQCHDALLKDHERISLVIKIDARRGSAPGMAAKVSAVEERLDPKG